jgi:transposase InsO family protein
VTTDSSSSPSLLPRAWPERVKSAILHVISLAQLAVVRTRAWAANSPSARLRLKSELEEARSDIALLEEELRIKDARMREIDPRHRPHYRATERLAILEVKAARGWSRAQTARRFLVEPATIASWTRRVDEEGKSALLKLAEPLNRFPDYVRYVARGLRAICPSMGKKRIAQTLARAGLRLAVTTVGRMLEEKDRKSPESDAAAVEVQREEATGRGALTAKHPNHVWQVDLSVLPTRSGFWVPWIPFAIPQLWPFAWWVACLVDHYSRRVMGFAVYTREPDSREVRAFLGRTIAREKATPKYLVADKGGQFYSTGFKEWCRRRGIRARYAATGHRGATAIVERFFRTLKDELLRRIAVPLRREAMRREIGLFVDWFHAHRPHQGLGGRTPSEVYHGIEPAIERPRLEPRPRWPTDSPCPGAFVPIGSRPRTLELRLSFHGGRRQLPIVKLRQAA